MAKQPTLNDIVNILTAVTTINDNWDEIQTSFLNTLSRDGSGPNNMQADLDMDSNDILNAGTVSVSGRLYVRGVEVSGGGSGGGGGAPGVDGKGWTGGSYNASTGVATFTSDDGLGFSTGDLRGADGTGGGLVFQSRAEAQAGDTDDLTFISVYGNDFVYDPTGTALTTGDGRTWSPSPHSVCRPAHWGATDNGLDTSPKFQAMLDWLANTDAVAGIRDGSRRIVDLEGKNYTLKAPLYIGKFDFNLDGTFELGSGPINGVKFINGRLTAASDGVWPDHLPDDVGKFLVYQGVVQNSNYTSPDGSGNMFEVANITFDNVELDCGFKTGGIWKENIHRSITDNCTIFNLGVDGKAVATPKPVSIRSRAILSANQETKVKNSRIEGNLRGDGLTDYPDGKSDFNSGGEIFSNQTVPSGAFTLNGSDVAGGEYVSGAGEALYVEFKNAYAASGPFTDLSGVTFTITGFADFAKTVAISETLAGPRGGNRIRFAHSVKKYAVVTSITSDTADASSVMCSSSYNTVGVEFGTNDFHFNNNVVTSCTRAADLYGRAGEFKNNHPWSREIVVHPEANKINFIGNYFDYTDVILRNSFRHQFTGNSWQIGSCNLVLIATDNPENGLGLNVVGNIFTEQSDIEFLTEGGGVWSDKGTFLATILGNSYNITAPKQDTIWANLNVVGSGYIKNDFEVGGTITANDPTLAQEVVTKSYGDANYLGGGGSTTFSALTDTPASMTSEGGKATFVNQAGTALEYSATLTLDGTGYPTFAAGLSVTNYLTVGGGASFGGQINMNSNRIINLANPVFGQDAATVDFVNSYSVTADLTGLPAGAIRIGRMVGYLSANMPASGSQVTGTLYVEI